MLQSQTLKDKPAKQLPLRKGAGKTNVVVPLQVQNIITHSPFGSSTGAMLSPPKTPAEFYPLAFGSYWAYHCHFSRER